MGSETCLPLTAELCDIEKDFVVSEPSVPLGTKHVGQTYLIDRPKSAIAEDSPIDE